MSPRQGISPPLHVCPGVLPLLVRLSAAAASLVVHTLALSRCWMLIILLLPERCQRCDLPCEPQLRGRGRPSKQNKAVAAQREKEKAGIPGADSHGTSWNPLNIAMKMLGGLKSVALQNLTTSRVLATAAAFRIPELEKTEPRARELTATQSESHHGCLLQMLGLVGCDAETLRRHSPRLALRI